MDNIDKQKFEEEKKKHEKEDKEETEKNELTEERFQELLEEIQDPIKAQQSLAVTVKHSLDKRISEEMKTKGCLSDNTRRWIESYNNILEKLQKAMFGEKSVNLNIHKISHADIATKIRESQKKHG